MHPTYIVKSGDTLTKIANLHRANLDELRALNPIIQHSDRLTPGWELKLPGKLPRPVLPPPMNAGDFSCTLVEGIPPCTEELIDIVHLTDDSHFHILTHRQSVELKYETQLIQKLMDDLHQNLAKVPEGAQCTFTQTPEAACPCSGCVKREWALKAEEMGVLSLAAETPATTFIAESRQDNLKEQAAIVQEALVWYRAYVPVLGAGNWGESNWRTLQTKKCKELEAELLRLRNEIAALSEPTSTDSSSKASSTRPDSKYSKGLGKDYAKEVTAKPGKGGISVLEIKVFSEPGRRHYIRHSFAGRLEWKVKVSTSVMQGKPFDKQLAKDLIKDIREKISTARKSGPLGGLEGKINLWTSKEDNLLNALHRETAWSSNESDAAPYAYSAEAQALRFAACASAGITNWEPSNGLIDVGFKGSAEYALAQGSVALTAFFPNQGGHLVTMAYRNAEGEVAHRPMGVFRMSGKLELSCFAGAQLSAEAGVKLQIRPPEMPAGSTVLLGRPTIGEGPNGRVGVKCGGFAGAQVGGAVSGTFEWIEPSKYATGAVKPGQANDSSNWASLATIKMEGNVSYGAGATGEFGIDITGNQFTINCAGSVVFGPGAGGGFGTVVDVEQVGKLVLLLCNTLAEMDYRQLLGVTEDAFNFASRGLFKLATSPTSVAKNFYENSSRDMKIWWSTRKASKAEAYYLADQIINNNDRKSLSVNGQDIPFELLPPETLGPMIYLLTERYVESVEEIQEMALVVLLSGVRSWRHFMNVLERCSPDGSKVEVLSTLERINSLLDGAEQRDFNEFVRQLAINDTPDASNKLAWEVGKAYKHGIARFARNSGKFDGLA